MFSRVGQVPAGLLQARFVQAGLHAAVHAARRAFRAAVHAARDAAPCRPSGPPRRWVELRAPTRPPIPVRETCFAGETIFHSIFSFMSNFWILVWRLDGGTITIIARAVLDLARLNRLVLRRLCRNWESSQRYGSCFLGCAGEWPMGPRRI